MMDLRAMSELEAYEYRRAEENRRGYIIAQCGFLLGARKQPPKFVQCPIRPEDPETVPVLSRKPA